MVYALDLTRVTAGVQGSGFVFISPPQREREREREKKKEKNRERVKGRYASRVDGRERYLIRLCSKQGLLETDHGMA